MHCKCAKNSEKKQNGGGGIDEDGSGNVLCARGAVQRDRM